MIAITKETVSYRAIDNISQLSDNEVEFTGDWIIAENGITPLMVWDNQLQNARQMNNAEIQQQKLEQTNAAKVTQALLKFHTKYPDPLQRYAIFLNQPSAYDKTQMTTDLLASIGKEPQPNMLIRAWRAMTGNST